jgi:adenylosuccinate lyase
MIPRYTRPEMAAIFEPENRFKIWLEIETLAAEKMAELGTVPKSVPVSLRKKGRFDIARIDEIEKEVKHDVIAFLTSVAEHVGPDSRYVHQGMTSSDVVDTAFAVQLTQAADLLLKDLDGLLKALKNAQPNIRKPSASAAATESTPSRQPSASNSPVITPLSNAQKKD